jgi:ABC-2 type transport system ATP-binding protein
MIGRGEIVAQGTASELVAGAGTYVRAVEKVELARVAADEGIALTPVGDGFRGDVEAVALGRLAAKHQITLIELRPADGGLEDLFLELTADTQRETFTEGVTA